MTETHVSTPIPPDLLMRMHDVAAQLEASDKIVLRKWGVHLMEDWRTLELLAEQYR